jgi:hypothetical protein
LTTAFSGDILALSRGSGMRHAEGGDAMRPLQARQGAVAGFAMSLILSAVVASQSADPLSTFLTLLVVTLTITVLGTAGAVAINRRSRPPDAD